MKNANVYFILLKRKIINLEEKNLMFMVAFGMPYINEEKNQL